MVLLELLMLHVQGAGDLGLSKLHLLDLLGDDKLVFH